MLERIFYLEEYGKLLTDKLNRKIDRLRSCLDTLSGELRGYQDASDEALKEAGKAMEAAAAEKEKALRLYKELELEYNQARRSGSWLRRWQILRSGKSTMPRQLRI